MKQDIVNLELEDIQGLILRGYKRMQFAKYILLEIEDLEKTKKWLHDIADELTNTETKELQNCLNIAFTNQGLLRLGLYTENLNAFSQEFRDGMNEEHRSRLLGDIDSSAPTNWRWGHADADRIHILLLVFGATQADVDNFYNLHSTRVMANGMSIVHTLEGQTLPNNKEHFGFRDGISQPDVIGSGRVGPPNNMIKPGEFILGYKNEYDVLPDSPYIQKTQGNINLLPEDSEGMGKKDLGRNGSYLVFRQIEQDVEAFWTFMNEKSKNKEEALMLASKMMGRWPSGAPLVKFPDKDPGGNSDDNDFGYLHNDPQGLKCPFGSHIRRTNPRNHFETSTEANSLMITKRHRIMRRARLYGQPFAGSPDNYKPEGEVGLQFICFQSDIGKQFEFIQHTWCNYPNFMDLYDDPDPIVGVRDNALPGYTQNFTIQAEPVSKTITILKPFTKIRGGAYFFFPGIVAVRYLATL